MDNKKNGVSKSKYYVFFMGLMNRLTIVLLASFSISANGADLSPASEFKWNHTSFCTKTISSYIDSYEDGEKEFVHHFLKNSEFFADLTKAQRRSFVNLVEYYYQEYENNRDKEKTIGACISDLEDSIRSVSMEDHLFCSDLARKIQGEISVDRKALGFKIKKESVEKFPDIAYQECMRKITTHKNKGYKIEEQ